MGMRGQPVVSVLFDAVMRLARLVRGIDVDDDERQIIQTMQEPMADLGGDRVRLCDRQPRIDGDVELGVQAMAEPARPHLGHPRDLRHMLGRMPNLADDRGSAPSSTRMKIDFALWMTMAKIAAVMMRPTIGSASG